MTSEQLYETYKTKMQKIADVKFSSAVLQWDQETYLPPQGAAIRGKQIATLSEMGHSLFTEENTGSILNELFSRDDLDEHQKRNVSLSLVDYERDKKLPPSFVHRLSETTNNSFHAWMQARRENSFSVFEKPLTAIIDLKKQQADLMGYADHPYDALMDEFDKGITVKKLDALFENLRPKLSTLIDKIKTAPQIDDSFLHLHFNKQKQWDLGINLLKAMHYDFDAGRQDISEHPFTIHFNSRDVRITTRIDENNLSNMVWSCIHEGGHALYEQGIPADEYGLPLGECCSLSIHESQSRLWENCIGHGRNFWEFHYPELQKLFKYQLEKVNLNSFYKGINKVRPSLIRTEADEITYHFHVMIRYELEKKLVEGSITTADIPAWWNEHYHKYLGVIVPNDKDGCLQDVHWSHGSFGYFPTYSLGSLYAAQFYSKMLETNSGMEHNIAEGNTIDVWKWLQQHIYQHGRYYNSEELCRQATGESLNTDHFIAYASAKINDIYNL